MPQYINTLHTLYGLLRDSGACAETDLIPSGDYKRLMVNYIDGDGKRNYMSLVRTSRVRIRVYYEDKRECVSTISGAYKFVVAFLKTSRVNIAFKKYLNENPFVYQDWAQGNQSRRKAIRDHWLKAEQAKAEQMYFADSAPLNKQELVDPYAKRVDIFRKSIEGVKRE